MSCMYNFTAEHYDNGQEDPAIQNGIWNLLLIANLFLPLFF